MLRRPHWAGTDCDVHISRLPPAGSALVSLPQGWTWQHHGREPRGKASRVWAGGEQGAGSRGTQGWHVTGTRRGGDFPAVMHKAPGARRGHCTGSLEGPCPWAQHAPRDMPSVPKSDLLLSPSPHCCLVQAPKPTRPLPAQPSAGPSLLRNAPPPHQTVTNRGHLRAWLCPSIATGPKELLWPAPKARQELSTAGSQWGLLSRSEINVI